MYQIFNQVLGYRKFANDYENRMATRSEWSTLQILIFNSR